MKNGENSLTVKVAKFEALAKKTYKIGWDNAIAQTQHFFVDKDINFAALNEEEFLDDMLSERAQEANQDESKEETPRIKEAPTEVQAGSEVPTTITDKD